MDKKANTITVRSYTGKKTCDYWYDDRDNCNNDADYIVTDSECTLHACVTHLTPLIRALVEA